LLGGWLVLLVWPPCAAAVLAYLKF